jgi:hypothetical protein
MANRIDWCLWTSLAPFEDSSLKFLFCGGCEFCEIQQGVGGERYSVYFGLMSLVEGFAHLKFLRIRIGAAGSASDASRRINRLIISTGEACGFSGGSLCFV